METPLLLGKESDANIVDGRDSAPRGKKFLDDDDDDAPLHDAITAAIPTRKIIDRVGMLWQQGRQHSRHEKWCVFILAGDFFYVGSPTLLSYLHYCGGERRLLRNHRNPSLFYSSLVTI
jgi:hypothetical protein